MKIGESRETFMQYACSNKKKIFANAISCVLFAPISVCLKPGFFKQAERDDNWPNCVFATTIRFIKNSTLSYQFGILYQILGECILCKRGQRTGQRKTRPNPGSARSARYTTAPKRACSVTSKWSNRLLACIILGLHAISWGC